MKNLRKNLIITMIMVVAALAFMVKGVSATGGLNLNPGTSGGNTTPLNTTGLNTTTTNTTPLNTTRTNIVKTNNINTGDKDLPQTGENDIYIVTGIGILVIAIGGFAYIKSKRF